MPKKIKVSLVTNYVGDAQFSMITYAEQLEKSLRFSFPDLCDISIHTPSGGGFGRTIRRFSTGRKIDSYWNRFVVHPAITKKISGGINHITDHNNSYLIRYLDPLRTVITCHDLIYFCIPKKVRDNMLLFSPQHKIRKYTVSGLTMAAKIIADSESTKKDIVELFRVPSDNIKVIYPGIRPSFYTIKNTDIFREGRKRFHINWDKTILHVGDNSYYKNVEAVLNVIKLLNDRLGEDIHLVKVGKDFTHKQKLIHDLKIVNYIHNFGNIGDVDLNLIYNLSDVLVFPSLYEGFGWPPLELCPAGTGRLF